jgi:pyruvate/2-oxoglutarate dehydrogenase complex dihydrolipoamide dehydrogenase (E3) component
LIVSDAGVEGFWSIRFVKHGSLVKKTDPGKSAAEAGWPPVVPCPKKSAASGVEQSSEQGGERQFFFTLLAGKAPPDPCEIQFQPRFRVERIAFSRYITSMNTANLYDFAILGGGSAGYAAARTAASLGLKTVVIDGAETLGGLCILRGCMPSKTLIESANRNLAVRQAQDFGLNVTPGPVRTDRIRDRKRALIAEFAEYRQGQLEDGRFTLIRGTASFEESPADCVRLRILPRDGAEAYDLEARTAMVATGSALNVPAIPGLQETGFWTSDTLLDAAEIPPSFVVLGGGAIALEMAHFLEGIDRTVTVIQRSPHLLTGMDADLADVVQKALQNRGMTVACGTTILNVETTARGKKVTYEQDGKEHQVEAAEILVALGRRAATDTLETERAGISLSKAGQIQVNTFMQTTQPRIFAAGDVCGPLEVVHLAIQQAETAAKNAAALLNGAPLPHQMDYRCKLFGVFTQPEAAVVGLSETEAQERGIPILTASYDFGDHGKSLVMGEKEGFVKLLANPVTGALLGGAVVGPHATELIHEVSIAMHLGATAAQLATAPHYHPTLSEIWTYPAEDLAELTGVKF